MALYPTNYSAKESLQPGARGEMFRTDIPGYRGNEDRINRTNMKLATSLHDVPNIKYELDARLPVLFRYSYSIGFNQLVMPKGRIVALDPNVNQIDFDTHKAYNVLTLANGGSIVKLKEDGKTWEKANIEVVEGVMKDGEHTIAVDNATGMITVDGVPSKNYRAANRPIGLIQRNEYTRDDNALNGMQPGAVLTDALVELPLFLTQDKAEANPWGSAYGNILPGDYVKSDANGRLIPSPLNSAAQMVDAGITTAVDIELEKQQIVGQVYEVNRDLLPAGAAKYAQWAISDRMNFDLYNPDMWRNNNRRGEDTNEKSPYNLSGGGAVNTTTSMTQKDNIKGYPYDQTLTQNDLHMMGATLRKSDLRMPLAYRMEDGIPGLTDGYNAVTRSFGPENLGVVNTASTAEEYVDLYLKFSEVNIEERTVSLAITNKDLNALVDADFTPVATAGQGLKVKIGETASENTLINVKYLDEKQGFLVLEIADKNAFHEFMTQNGTAAPVRVYAKFNKRGLAGVPTTLDWDGCQGTVSVLLQK